MLDVSGNSPQWGAAKRWLSLILSRKLLVLLVASVHASAFFVSMSFDPAGFDRCEAVPTADQLSKQLWAEGTGIGLAGVAVVLLVIGYRRDRTRGLRNLPRFLVALALVLTMTGLVALRWLSGFGADVRPPSC